MQSYFDEDTGAFHCTPERDALLDGIVAELYQRQDDICFGPQDAVMQMGGLNEAEWQELRNRVAAMRQPKLASEVIIHA